MLKTILKTVIVVGLFFMIEGVSRIVQASDLNQETVSSLWPYPEKILKVVAANANIQKEGQTYRLAEVIAKSETTQTCQLYQANFKPTGDGWEFGSVESKNEVSCKNFKFINASSAKTSSSSTSGSTDPRNAVEKGVNETQRTVDDVNDTVNMGRSIKHIFNPY